MPEQFPDHINTSSLFSSLLRNSKDTGIFLIDKEGKILETNVDVFASLGYRREEVIGNNISVLFTPEDQKNGTPQEELKKTLETGSTIEDYYLVKKDGTPLWVHSETILSDKDHFSYIIKIIHDTNFQKELEKELIQKNSDFNSFVYVASHDLKGPISNIEGLVSMLPDVVNNEEGFSQIYDLLKVSVDKFKSLLEDLPSLAKPKSKEKPKTN